MGFSLSWWCWKLHLRIHCIVFWYYKKSELRLSVWLFSWICLSCRTTSTTTAPRLPSEITGKTVEEVLKKFPTIYFLMSDSQFVYQCISSNFVAYSVVLFIIRFITQPKSTPLSLSLKEEKWKKRSKKNEGDNEYTQKMCELCICSLFHYLLCINTMNRLLCSPWTLFSSFHALHAYVTELQFSCWNFADH